MQTMAFSRRGPCNQKKSFLQKLVSRKRYPSMLPSTSTINLEEKATSIQYANTAFGRRQLCNRVFHSTMRCILPKQISVLCSFHGILAIPISHFKCAPKHECMVAKKMAICNLYVGMLHFWGNRCS